MHPRHVGGRLYVARKQQGAEGNVGLTSHTSLTENVNDEILGLGSTHSAVFPPTARRRSGSMAATRHKLSETEVSSPLLYQMEVASGDGEFRAVTHVQWAGIELQLPSKDEPNPCS